ncbi:MAG: esterase-like activity of phytase family protein, partial [Kordiimonas sp.]
KLGAVAEHYDTGVDLSGLSHNSGIEAMTVLQDGGLLMFAESGRDTKGRTPAWVASSNGGRSVEFFPPENYEATDAATLPNGDVLLLMRYYSVLTGASAQIRHISKDEIASGVIRGKQIAELKRPLNVDNMEGLDVQILEDGTVRLFVISDDNFSSRQRTLFMVFDWPQG